MKHAQFIVAGLAMLVLVVFLSVRIIPQRDPTLDAADQSSGVTALMLAIGGRPYSGQTARRFRIDYGVSAGREEIVRLLPAKGANPAKRNAGGESALKWAQEQERRESVSLLRQAGATR